MPVSLVSIGVWCSKVAAAIILIINNVWVVHIEIQIELISTWLGNITARVSGNAGFARGSIIREFRDRNLKLRIAIVAGRP
jgi:hypothetical protein